MPEAYSMVKGPGFEAGRRIGYSQKGRVICIQTKGNLSAVADSIWKQIE
jgi:hypothetical protein